MVIRKSQFFLAGLLCLSFAGPALADSASAEALFRAGREAAKKEDWAAACRNFHESNRLDPAPGTQLNIADCEERQGRLATAWTFYKQVAEQLSESDERRTFASGKINALEPRLPYLAISLAPGAPPESTVTRNGVELRSASLALALPVDPGKQEIVVRAPGHEPGRYNFTLKEGERRQESVEPGKALPAGQGANRVHARRAESGQSEFHAHPGLGGRWRRRRGACRWGRHRSVHAPEEGCRRQELRRGKNAAIKRASTPRTAARPLARYPA